VTIVLATVPLVLVGHSHVALQIALSGEEIGGGVAPAGTELELDGLQALLNPGSVGQPRDSDPRAAYLVLDLETQHASFRRVEYDVARTQREIREAGLPDLLAARLELGI
jgi:diadenosine tetraphosphatase ApaH/serine/threonine PP2A family protein phosphatase